MVASPKSKRLGFRFFGLLFADIQKGTFNFWGEHPNSFDGQRPDGFSAAEGASVVSLGQHLRGGFQTLCHFFVFLFACTVCVYVSRSPCRARVARACCCLYCFGFSLCDSSLSLPGLVATTLWMRAWQYAVSRFGWCLCSGLGHDRGRGCFRSRRRRQLERIHWRPLHHN